VDALHEIAEGNFHGVAAGLQMEAIVMTEIELAENAVGHGRGGHDHVGGLRVDFGLEGAGANLRGALGDVDEQFVEISGGDDGGAVGFELQLQLGNFQRDGLGDVGGSGRKKQSDGQ